VAYWDPIKEFPHQRKKLGRWLGVAENCTDKMAYHVLTGTGHVLVRRDVWSLTEDELASPEWREQMIKLDADLLAKLGDSLKAKEVDADLVNDLPSPPDDIFDDDEEVAIPADPEAEKPEADDYTPDSFDNYLTAEVLLPRGGELKRGTVTSRKRDINDRPIGLRYSNPILDTREYEVIFPDGSTEDYTANTIAENMYAQVDQEGRTFAILDEVVGHRTNGHALSKDDGFFMTRSGKKAPVMTTRGWELQVQWKDGTTTWVPLKDIKGSNPVQVAEYAVANKIAEEPAFTWWVRGVLRRRDRIIKKVKSRY
jgi:hypothetical protein